MDMTFDVKYFVITFCFHLFEVQIQLIQNFSMMLPYLKFYKVILYGSL